MAFQRTRASDALDVLFIETGETFEELAARLGTTGGTLSKYYKGEAIPGPAMRRKFAAVEPVHLPEDVWDAS